MAAIMPARPMSFSARRQGSPTSISPPWRRPTASSSRRNRRFRPGRLRASPRPATSMATALTISSSARPRPTAAASMPARPISSMAAAPARRSSLPCSTRARTSTRPRARPSSAPMPATASAGASPRPATSTATALTTSLSARRRATMAAPAPARPISCSAAPTASPDWTSPHLDLADGFVIQGDAAGDQAGFSVSLGRRHQRRRLSTT